MKNFVIYGVFASSMVLTGCSAKSIDNFFMATSGNARIFDGQLYNLTQASLGVSIYIKMATKAWLLSVKHSVPIWILNSSNNHAYKLNKSIASMIVKSNPNHTPKVSIIPANTLTILLASCTHLAQMASMAISKPIPTNKALKMKYTRQASWLIMTLLICQIDLYTLSLWYKIRRAIRRVFFKSHQSHQKKIKTPFCHPSLLGINRRTDFSRQLCQFILIGKTTLVLA